MIMRNELSVEQVERLKDLFRYEYLGFGFDPTMSRVDDDVEIWIMYPNFLLIFLGGSESGGNYNPLKHINLDDVTDEYLDWFFN